MKTDIEIQKDILQEFKWQPLLRSASVRTEVKNGVVILSGTVDSYLKKILAEKVSRRVAGVKAIAEGIEVKYPANLQKSDSEIANAISGILKWHSVIHEENVHATVENGVVTLEGEVAWRCQKNHVEFQVEKLIGVTKIINKLKVTLRTNEMQENISKRFA